MEETISSHDSSNYLVTSFHIKIPGQTLLKISQCYNLEETACPISGKKLQQSRTDILDINPWHIFFSFLLLSFNRLPHRKPKDSEQTRIELNRSVISSINLSTNLSKNSTLNIGLVLKSCMFLRIHVPFISSSSTPNVFKTICYFNSEIRCYFFRQCSDEWNPSILNFVSQVASTWSFSSATLTSVSLSWSLILHRFNRKKPGSKLPLRIKIWSSSYPSFCSMPRLKHLAWYYPTM